MITGINLSTVDQLLQYLFVIQQITNGLITGKRRQIGRQQISCFQLLRQIAIFSLTADGVHIPKVFSELTKSSKTGLQHAREHVFHNIT
ncbi:MAG: hypothetical protein AseanaTS_18640 [Candidatus Pelagadaptatus aseana]